MSVGRDVIADACGVQEERVRCLNCQCAERENFNGLYFCSAWEQYILESDFCSFWRDKDEGVRGKERA